MPMARQSFTWLPSRAGLCAVVLASACAQPARFPLAEPLWEDPDRRVFAAEPEEYFSPFAWDAADQTLFRPLTRVFAVDPAGEAANVNAVDEVPNSSWFQNRIGRRPMTPEAVYRGPCEQQDAVPARPWTVIGAKPNGANPGFMIRDAEEGRHLVKFDGVVQGPRATAADVIVSKLYHAAGYNVPCNRVVTLEREWLQIGPEATAEDEEGEKEPLTWNHLEQVLSMSSRTPDGQYRASLSTFLDGKPIGPFTYQGLRDDDPNDVVPHQERRELRGMRVLAAWVNHFDSREQNTLDTWMEVTKGRGYIRHNVIDFGDCFGSVWEPPMLGRRIGHANYIDLRDVFVDFVSLGAVQRPWDTARFGPSGAVFGYFDIESFDVDAWDPGYPNPAFGRATERDEAWMARIIARIGSDQLKAAVRAGSLPWPLDGQLTSILDARRAKLLERYLLRLSPLTEPRLEAAGSEKGSETRLCLDDLSVEGGVVEPAARAYGAVLRAPQHAEELLPLVPSGRDSVVCVALPAVPAASPANPRYLVVDVVAHPAGRSATWPARVHLYATGARDHQVVGLERPETFAASP